MDDRPPKVMQYAPQHGEQFWRGYDAMNRLTEEHVVGYSAKGARHLVQREMDGLGALFAGTGLPVPYSSAVAIYSDSDELLGAAMLEPRFDATLAQVEPERSRDIATLHTVLAGMFVLPEHRRRGVGRRLLQTVRVELSGMGVRYLEGFSDERGASAEFYSAIGAHVMDRDAPILPRWPTNFQADPPHHLGIRGHWFYFDMHRELVHQGLFTCSRCGGHFTLEPDEPGGALACSCARSER